MASSPPGVDIILSWILVTEFKPTWLLREQDEGEEASEPMEAVEKCPGRWFSLASKYLFLRFWLSSISDKGRHATEGRAGEKGKPGVEWKRNKEGEGNRSEIGQNANPMSHHAKWPPRKGNQSRKMKQTQNKDSDRGGGHVYQIAWKK